METSRLLTRIILVALSNKNYVSNAPKAVVSQTRTQLEEAKAQLAKLSAEQKRFS